MAGDSTGLLILRVNADPRFLDGLRIHVRLTGDLSLGFESSRTMAGVDEAVGVVANWLTTFARGGRELS